MVTAKESQMCPEFSAWNSSYLDYMALLRLERIHSSPCIPSSRANFVFPGQPASNLPGFNTGQQNAVDRFLKPVSSPYCNISYQTECPYLKNSENKLNNGLPVTDKPNRALFAPQKKFLIFDQSGNQTRLFFSSVSSSANGLFGGTTAKVNPEFLMKPGIEEKWDENHLSDGEGEMLEDSDEINALFFSDSDDEYDDDVDNDDDNNYDQNDEVSSTGHSPSTIDDKLLEELIDDVATFDYSPKRRKLLNGKYEKTSRANSCDYEDENSYDHDEIDSSKREKKVNIRRALKILESIVPGLNSDDPISIIDKAIVYLKSMKIEAEALGLSDYPGGKSVISP